MDLTGESVHIDQSSHVTTFVLSAAANSVSRMTSQMDKINVETFLLLCCNQCFLLVI